MKKSLPRLFSEIETIPPVLQSSYYPSLDGFRGIAIIMVVVSHLGLTSGTYYDMVFNGKAGVLIFFVLSGFLITTLCIKEKVITSTISLKSFYIRRVLRIVPVAYLYLITIIILNAVFKLDIGYIGIVGAALYIMNISSFFRTHSFSWDTAHFWSLAVEEQFYLAVPLILKKNFRAYMATILLIIFVLPLFLCLQSVFPPLNNIVLYAFSHYLIKFQAIAIGCFFSVLVFKYSFNNTILNRFKIPLNLLAIVVLLYINYDDFLTIKNMFSGTAVSLLAGYLIVSNLSPAKDFIFKLLNTRALKIVGVLSYSIYIWQQVFTSNDSKLPRFMVAHPYNIITLLVVSCLSYYFYESYFLRLKAKFAKIRSK